MTSQPSDLTSRLKKWNVSVIVHVWPTKDLIEHNLFGPGCSCGAKIEEDVMNGAPCWRIKHNALDGRE